MNEDLVVHLNTQNLLDVLKKNKETHRKVFEEAIEGYRKKALATLQQNLDNIKAGKIERVYVSLALPEDHTRDYERVIKMLEMHQNEYLDLTQAQFAQYVMDDWGWRQAWLDTAKGYGSLTALSLDNNG